MIQVLNTFHVDADEAVEIESLHSDYVELKTKLEELRVKYDDHLTELLEANNRELERRRLVERELREPRRNMPITETERRWILNNLPLIRDLSEGKITAVFDKNNLE